MLVTATLFIRPGEIFQPLLGFEFFFYFIVSCFLLSFQTVFGQLSKRSLQSQPITVCVLGILMAIVLSDLAHFEIEALIDQTWAFVKTLMYYLLLVGLVNTPKRLRQFLFWLWFFTLIFIILTLLNHHGIIHLNMRVTATDSYVSKMGEVVGITRMTGSGLFADPNDLCMVTNMGFVLGLYWLGDRLYPLPRVLYLASSLTFGYALLQTQSRGGFLALLLACSVLLLNRYGWKKAAMIAAPGLPVLMVAIGGRITHISTEESTAQSRMEMWALAFELFKSSPLFGVGAGKFLQYSELVAHNAYIHAYAELGLFGGSFFIAAFFWALWTLYQMGKGHLENLEPNLRRAHAYITAIIAGAATLLMTLSQTYYMTTYMILGLVTVYLRITNASNLVKFYRVDSFFIKRLSVIGIVAVVTLNVIVRVLK